MRKILVSMMLAVAVLPGMAAADDAHAGEVPAPPDAIGVQTKLWLSTQIAAPATDPRPMPGEQATLVYQRYLNSFAQPIPQYLGGRSFTTSTTGGGSN